MPSAVAGLSAVDRSGASQFADSKELYVLGGFARNAFQDGVSRAWLPRRSAFPTISALSIALLTVLPGTFFRSNEATKRSASCCLLAAQRRV